MVNDNVMKNVLSLTTRVTSIWSRVNPITYFVKIMVVYIIITIVLSELKSIEARGQTEAQFIIINCQTTNFNSPPNFPDIRHSSIPNTGYM